MAMVGDMLNSYRDHSQATVNYVMFTSAFALLTLFYLIAAEISDTFEIHPLIRFIVDLLNTLFLFAAAVALPSKLHVPDCDNHVRPPLRADGVIVRGETWLIILILVLIGEITT